MKSRNFNYIGDDLIKEWESLYLKNNPQIKKSGLRHLDEIREKDFYIGTKRKKSSTLKQHIKTST